ncbi:hypothetical protein NBO_434g0003 [Nosema bombycis CQ1]|jgi:ribosome-binding protein aMBF1 (putative translation factor)|uniref:HTH cro/C1-type domain-containing protein n=1 Tax=Nosema bombycis (strain CQ1 / CVCC 102059) TaxID=578461 RepID=R0KQI9_NOSB1|nr:hypothetical protein NBO_434g0003 [Nosema bombycis CQ1]|eukprot:EOB12472.1 hypothetical protein NBO_434g0003 [Nosema bombycis CQ1]
MYDDKPIIIRKTKKETGPKNIVSLDDKELKLVPRNVSEKIKRGREKLMMNQKELAMKLGKKVSVISEWEAGKAQFEEKLAKKFEQILNVKFEE